ncbi:MFS transporter [Streptomyces reticuli]|uniref:MFS transporter n=1 Tax=Streptomyces reticuli TaxID=1926 RepID=UPI00073DBAE4|nr:Antiseptic resistance protein [Streptomyces reticuli]
MSAGVVCSGLFLLGLDLTVLNVALPELQTALGSSAGQTQWIVDAYALVLGGLVLTAGGITDRIGRRRAFLAGLATCGLASVAGATAALPWQLIGARGAMGAGAALIMPATLSLLTSLFPEPQPRRRAISLWAAVGGAGGALGPVIGGWLVAHQSWRAVFWLNVPCAVAIIVLTLLVVPAPPPARTEPVDLPGTALSATGLLALVWAIIEGPARGWTSTAVLSASAVGAALLTAFAVWVRRAPAAMLPRHVLRREVAVPAAALAMMAFGMFGALFVISLYLQGVLGCTPWQAGVRTVPLPAALIAGAALAAGLTARLTQRSLMVSGLAVVAGSFVLLSRTTPESGYPHLAVVQIAAGLGAGLTAAAGTAAVMESVGESYAGVGSAVNDATRQVGATLGVAVQGSVLATVYRDRVGEALAHADLGGVPSAAKDSVVAAALAGRHAAPAVRGHLLAAATDAFVAGLTRSAAVAAVVAAGGAVAVWRGLPRPAADGSSPRPEKQDGRTPPGAERHSARRGSP